MQFKTRRVELDGATIELRELSAGAAEAAERQEGDFAQSLAMLALSLVDEKGEPAYTAETLADGVAYVRDLPVRLVRDVLLPAVAELNAVDLDDARGN